MLRGISSGCIGLFQFPLSLLGERIGEVIVIVLGTFGLAGGFLLLSKSHTFLTILFSLVFAKVTGAGQHGLSSSVLSRVFEVSGRRAAMGTYNFSGDLGKVCIPFLLALMINLWGWRQAVFTISLGGMAVGIILYALASKQKEHPPSSHPIKPVGLEGTGWGIKNRKKFLALLTIGIIDISARYALLTFLPFLLLQKGIPVTRFGFALTLLFAGGAVGKFACGILAEWFGIIPMVVGTEVLTTVGILSLTMLPASWVWFVLPLVGIVLNGTSSVLYATVAEMISPASRARGYGLYYAITLGSGALSPLAFGLLTDLMGLSFTIVMTALMLVITLPLSRYLSPKP